jgi:hypothetical protein
MTYISGLEDLLKLKEAHPEFQMILHSARQKPFYRGLSGVTTCYIRRLNLSDCNEFQRRKNNITIRGKI